MKVLIATPLYPPEIGGPATYAKPLEEGLPSLGMDVAIVRFGEVRHLPKLFRHAAYLRKLLRAGSDADVILALDPVSTGLPAAIVAGLLGKPFVLKIVGDYAWEQGRQRFGVSASLDDFVRMGRVPFPVAALRAIQRWVASRAMRIIVPSEYLGTIVRAWGIPERKIEIIYNAVPKRESGIVPSAVSSLPQPLIVTIARLVPWKGIIGLIDAVAQVRAGGGAVSLAIVGDGPDRAMLNEHASRTLGTGYIFTGALSPDDTQAVMRSTDVFVLNSAYEGLSHVLIEALVAGKPVIATDVGGNAEVLGEHGGVLIPAGSTAALAENLAVLVRDEGSRRRMAIAASARAERFTVATMLERTREVLSSVI